MRITLFLLFFFLIAAFNCAHAVVYQAERIPWSGWWWPYTEGGLGTGVGYRGSPAPLEKYEMLMSGISKGDALQWYMERYYDPNAPYWYGLCGYWARAACYEDIQFFPSVENNIVFRIGDKKGLVTLAHNNDLSVREEGRQPEIFHYWLLHYIKDRKVPFMFDLDPGPEGWSYALYKYDMNTVTFPDREEVEVTIFYADDYVQPDYVGTKTSFNTYTYTLFTDGAGNITGGEWSGASVDDHPDGLTFPILARNSCDALDYNEVLRIAAEKDDEYEGEEIPVLSPGSYNLILMNEDRYEISCSAGDLFHISIEKQQGGEQPFSVKVTDGSENMVGMNSVSLKTPFQFSMVAINPPYTVSITQGDYSDPNIYTMIIDLKKSMNQAIPYIPKNGQWSGFVVTNPTSDPIEDVILAAYDSLGKPVQTLLGPIDLQPGEKRNFMFTDLIWRSHDYDSLDQIYFMSNDNTKQLNMVGSSKSKVAASFVQNKSRGYHLVIPDTFSSMNFDKNVLTYISNEALTTADITINVYSKSGQLITNVNDSLLPRERIMLRSGEYPYYAMPDDGWIDVFSTGPEEINGIQYLTSFGSAESLFAIPVGSKEKFIPHVPPKNGLWAATVTLINPNDAVNNIRLHPEKAGDDIASDVTIFLDPYEKRAISLTELFGYQSGDPLYHSIIKIDADHSIVGYYSYRPVNQTDQASFPLIEWADCGEELTLGHNAGKGGNWLTAAVVFNPTEKAVLVDVQPYDENGRFLEGIGKQIDLDKGSYEIITIQSFFGVKEAADISFIKFKAGGQGSSIGGFVLYCTTAKGMVTGINM